MKNLLHIIATPRGDESRTLKISNEFLNSLKNKNSEYYIDELNLFKEKLPELTLERVSGKYQLLRGENLFTHTKESWKEIIKVIDRFKSADLYLISTPMWNFSVPYLLKHYIDVIIQPKYLFQYTANGPEGLIKNKKMIIITSRGGDYSTDRTKYFDLLEPYLKTVFGFSGITDITFINAQPMDAGGLEVQNQKIAECISLAKEIANSI